MIKKYIKIFLFIFCLCTIFIVAKGANASFTDDDFSGYSSGQSVDTLGRWISPTSASYNETYITNSATCYAGNCVNMTETGGKGRDFYNTDTKIPTFGSFYAYSQYSNAVGTDLYLRIYDNASTSLGIWYLFDTDGTTVQSYFFTASGTNTFVGLTASSTWYKFSYNYNEATNEIRFRINAEDWSDWTELDNTPTNLTFRSQSVLPNGNRYLDQIDFEGFTDFEEATVIEVPNALNNIYVSSENFTFDSVIHCVIGTDCYVNYKYPINYIGKILYLHAYTANDLAQSDDYKILEQQNYLRGKMLLTAQTATTSIAYCISVVEAGEVETKFCDISVFWDSTLGGELGYFEPYDITTACEDIATSSGTYWDDFRYGIECGFNKSMYWLFHPSDNSMEGLLEAKNDILNEFPVNVYKNVWTKMYNATSTTATSTEIKIYGGFLSSESDQMISVGSLAEIKNLFSEAWDKIYLLLSFLIMGTTMLFFVMWFKNRNDY